jgi:PAS domain S-box-containing protein
LAELSETLQGGLAVLDADWRFTFVSERFLRGLWSSEELLDLDIRQLVSTLTDDDPRQLGQQVDRGHRVDFEERFLGADDQPQWYRITLLPLADLGGESLTVVFAKDVTQTRRALTRLRDATHALTEIENGLRRRVSREVHDGPIQVLAALVIRLGLLDDNETTRHVHAAVHDAVSEMRAAVASFSGLDQHVSAGSLLLQWINPCLVDSDIEVEIDDQLQAASELADVQAVFVFLYETIRGARFVGRRRRIRLTLRDEQDGIRALLTIDSSSDQSLEFGRVAAQYRVLIDHARSLGGTLSNHVDSSGVRLLSMWLPAAAPPATQGRAARAEGGSGQPRKIGAGTRRGNRVSNLPALDDATWLAIARAAPERLVEHDADGRFTFVNDVQHDMLGRTSDDLVGESMFAVFSEESMAELGPTFERLLAGETIDVQWWRNNAFGESRLVRVTTSPRLDDDGQLLGTLSAVDDLSDVHILQDLYESALADLGRTRRLVTTCSLRRLRPSIDASIALVRQLEDFSESVPNAPAFRAITKELERAIGIVSRSVGSLESPDSPIADLGEALRTAVADVNTGTDVRFSDDTSDETAPENISVLFRIAREAILNAIIHGNAKMITMRLSDDDGGLVLDIHDDGIGIQPGDLDQKPEHLGTRSMSERARELGGHCRIEPDPQGGTSVSVWLPHHTERASLVDASLLPS